LVQNGSFENHDTFQNEFGDPEWGYFSGAAGNQVANWTSATPTVPLEVGLGSFYQVTGFDGNDVMELDTTHNVAAVQTVLGTTPGETYTLSFLYALRGEGGRPAASGTFEVYWNGTLVASLNPTLTAMTLHSAPVLALGNDTLTFLGTGTDDSYGAIIDNIRVVPEPSTVLAAALLLLPFGASTLRLLRRNAKS
jgi:hypothetical protein